MNKPPVTSNQPSPFPSRVRDCRYRWWKCRWSGAHFRAMGSGTIRAVPEWVPRSRLMVSAAEDFLLWLFGATGSPEVLGSRVALAWVGGIDDARSPMINQRVEPTKRRVMTEFLIAAPISAGEPYPGAAWFRAEGLPAQVVPSAEFWQAHAGFAATRGYARGSASGFGWVLGVIEDLAHLTPLYWEDGGGDVSRGSAGVRPAAAKDRGSSAARSGPAAAVAARAGRSADELARERSPGRLLAGSFIPG